MKSINSRLLISYVLITLITVLLFESFLLLAIKRYYYDNISELLMKQAEISADFYNQYLSNKTLEEYSSELVTTFSQNTSAQIQILDSDGKVIGDSSFLYLDDPSDYPDVKKALKGISSSWQGYSSSLKDDIISVSYPLWSQKGVTGVIRFISSLKNANTTIRNISILLTLVGFIILSFIISISIVISRTITKPIRKLNSMASEIARGKFDLKVDIHQRDEVGALSENLNYMASELAHHEELKNNFISSISHDLRTPLTSIKGWAITLKTGDLKNESEVFEGLDIIEKESDRLSLMVEELLDFSKFESGKITLNTSQINLKSLLQYIQSNFQPRASQRSICISLDITPECNFIYGDELRLKQVLINLVDNSLKYTPNEGEINILAQCDKDNAIITVSDSGCGIDPNDLPKVTERFFKGMNSQSGSGLGLAICREIVELHGGELKIESTLGIRTKVQIVLPR